MTPERARKLLGGYATGTLTDEERRALLEAAIHDQELFNALAGEEVLRQALNDQPYRRELAAMLTPEPRSVLHRLAAWWSRPARLAWAGSLAALAIIAVVVYDSYPPPALREDAPSLLMIAPDAEMLVPEPPTASASEAESKKQSPQSTPKQVLGQLADTAAPDQIRRQTTRSFRVTPPPDEGRRARLITDEPPALATPEVRIKAEDIPGAAPSPPPPPANEQPPTTGPAVVAVQKEQNIRQTPAATEAASVLDSLESKKKLGMPLRRTSPAVGQSSPVMMARPGLAGYLAQPAGPLVLRIERRTPEGAFVDVPPRTSMALNDQIRFAVKTAAAGHLYLIDNSEPVTPHLLASLAVQPGVFFLVPLQGSLPPPQAPGVRTLIFLFSQKPLPLDVLGVSGKLEAKAATSSQEIILNYR